MLVWRAIGYRVPPISRLCNGHQIVDEMDGTDMLISVPLGAHSQIKYSRTLSSCFPKLQLLA